MSDDRINEWIQVNGYMTDDFRETVVEVALSHFPHASKKLKEAARRLFSRIKIPGFRSAEHAPTALMRPHLVEMIKRVPIAADTLIGLWAEAKEPMIAELRDAAVEAGLDLEPSWKWYDGIKGYYDFDRIEVLAKVADGLTIGRTEVEANHLRLAALWLSRAVIGESAGEDNVEGWDDESGSDGNGVDDSSDVFTESVETSSLDQKDDDMADTNTDSSTKVDLKTDEQEAVRDTGHDNLVDYIQAEAESTNTVLPEQLAGLARYETMSLEQLKLLMLEEERTHRLAREALIVKVRMLQQWIDDGKPRMVAEALPTIAGLSAEWSTAATRLTELIVLCAQRLASETTTRPDLSSHEALPQYLADLAKTGISDPFVPDIQGIVNLMDQIRDYDRQHQSTWEAVAVLKAGIAELLERIQYWTSDNHVHLPHYPDEQAELTLSELNEILEQIQNDKNRLDSQLAQLRKLSENRVENLISALTEFEIPADTQIVTGRALKEITPAATASLSDLELRDLEQALSDRVSQETTKASRVEFTDIATQLQARWDDQTLREVLVGLANHGRDAECFLLLVSASAAHPRAGVLNLEATVVESLLRGLGQFSDKSRPFELANLIAPELVNGWTTQDHVAQARMCLVFLAAQFTGDYRLPDGFLWQLPNEWPLTNMPNWSKLWQTALLEDTLPAIANSETPDAMSRLREARRSIEQAFEHDGRMFIMLKSFRSRRHIALMNNHFLPELQSNLKNLDETEAAIEDTIEQYPDQLTVLLPRLKRAIEAMRQSSSEEALLDKYEEVIAEEGVDDTHPFHRRIAHKTLQETAEVIAEYCAALLDYWESRVQHTTVLSRQFLEQELSHIPDPTPLEKPVLDELVLRGQIDMPVRDVTKANLTTARLIVNQLLGTAEFSSRLPRLICFLTEKPFGWSELVDPILQDLSTSLSTMEAATLLLEHEAVSQVLLLAKYGIPVEQQKNAQQMLDRMQREVSDLQMELLKTGGVADDLDNDRQLGRWRFVRQQLSKRLDRERERQRAAKQQVESQARRLRTRINELDEMTFDARDSMPPTAYELVAQGLQLVREATLKDELFSTAADYLNELSYRIDHASWPLADLQESIDRLSELVKGRAMTSETYLATEDILDLFEKDELRRLGLNSTLVTPSEIGTRADLLRNWITVRTIKDFLGEKMTITERSVIQTMYRSFAQMTVMRYSRTPDNKPIAYEYPAVYSLYELQYPKTPVLEKPCVLLTLPGPSLSPQHLKDVAYLIDERNWLDDAFVVLFAPGCTPKTRERLLLDYHNAGLVVIDESAMRELVLADADSRTPLGRFRSMMLNALGAADIDIFKVNQLVNARNAIFVGRDRLVDRISSGGDNYALYGGRRIGKSSVLAAIEARLLKRSVTVVSYSFEGNSDCSDNTTAIRLARELNLGDQMPSEQAYEQSIEVLDVDTFKMAVQHYLEANQDVRIALLLDEIDRYIDQNKDRHVLIEALRALSDRFTSRFRVVIAGFMNLHDCMKGRGPYSPASDPWGRMLNDIDALPNLRPNQAEDIVREGFREILDWQFENRAIPQLVVERTGGHPAFVQYFCLKLQHRVAQRGDRFVRIADIETVFNDRDPSQSFIAYVEKTLKDNLNPISRYLILLLAMESSDARGFTFDQIRELARYCPTQIPEKHLVYSLERLAVTSVVKEKASGVYEFTVPDYPLILRQLGITEHMKANELERQIKMEIKQAHGRD